MPVTHGLGTSDQPHRECYHACYPGIQTAGFSLLTDIKRVSDNELAASQATARPGAWRRGLEQDTRFIFTARLSENGRLYHIVRIGPNANKRGGRPRKYQHRTPQLLLDFQSGKTITQIAAEHGMRPNTVSIYLKRARAETTPPDSTQPQPLPPDLIAQATSIYLQPGITLSETSRRIRISEPILSRLLQQTGIGNLCLDCKRRTVIGGQTFCQPCRAIRRQTTYGRPARKPDDSERLMFQARYAGLSNQGQAVLEDIRSQSGSPVAYPRATATPGLWSRELQPGTPIIFTARITNDHRLIYITRTGPNAPDENASAEERQPDRNERKQMMALWATGRNFAYIAQQHRIPKRAVADCLRQAYAESGLIPPAGWHPKIRDPQAVANLYRQPGATKAELSQRLGISPITLDKVLAQAGIANLCRRCKQREMPKGSKAVCQQCAKEHRTDRYPDVPNQPAAAP